MPAPAVHTRLEGDLALIGSDAPLRRDLEWAIVTTAKPQEANTLYGLPTAPGIGTILRLVLV